MENLKIKIDNRDEIYRVNNVAKQTDGSILVTIDDTVILATVVVDYNKKASEDFLPLTVHYLEKQYANHKIPGGYIKRESKPSNFEVLTSRIIDRAIRPLFQKNFKYETLITITVLSAGVNDDLTTIAINSASLALYCSNVETNSLVTSLRITKLNEDYIVNPTTSELNNGSFDMLLCGDDENIFMIEFTSKNTFKTNNQMNDPVLGFVSTPIDTINVNELDENTLHDIFKIGKEEFKIRNKIYTDSFKNLGKDKHIIDDSDSKYGDKIKEKITKKYYKEIKKRHFQTDLKKQEKISIMREFCKEIHNDFSSENFDTILNIVDDISKDIIREEILKNGNRVDGRGLKDIREIDIEINILPNTHSSVLFTRGETQVLSTLTIGENSDAQMFDKLSSTTPFIEKFMLHYNFNNYSVKEVSKIGPPSRRELGHGYLAKKAILPTILDNSRVYRIVSEVLESNGSSSMATVCSASIALKAGKVEIDNLTAGIAMGLVVDSDDTSKYKILSDITGLEDGYGDLDFKIAGTKNGITALQMDTKIKGLKTEILIEALKQAKEGREHILNIMEEKTVDIEFSKALPSYEIFNINPSYIGEIIGQAGKTIKEIIDKFNIDIDINKKSGDIKMKSNDSNSLSNAKSFIESIITKKKSNENIIYKEGEIISGTVLRISDFGAFIELERGGTGLLHISKLSTNRVNKVTDIVNIDDKVKVEVLSFNNGKIELSLKEHIE